ncbi:MAG: hypothetical protein KF841_00565 [Phycisphaerae bacterium]|nr:hypothetical protein [Phycisphaerae bacterium]
MKAWWWYVIGTVIFWGAYVPTIHSGQLAFGTPKGPIRAFLFVGLAYFLVAVLVPGILLYMKAEPLTFPSKAVGISTFAGVLGALGALGIILSLITGGDPRVVPSLVFAGAPIMSVCVNMVVHPPSTMPDWRFFVGILLAAGGAALVLKFKPV